MGTASRRRTPCSRRRDSSTGAWSSRGAPLLLRATNRRSAQQASATLRTQRPRRPPTIPGTNVPARRTRHNAGLWRQLPSRGSPTAARIGANTPCRSRDVCSRATGGARMAPSSRRAAVAATCHAATANEIHSRDGGRRRPPWRAGRRPGGLAAIFPPLLTAGGFDCSPATASNIHRAVARAAGQTWAETPTGMVPPSTPP